MTVHRSVPELNQKWFDGYLLRNNSMNNKIKKTQPTDELLNGRIVKQTDKVRKSLDRKMMNQIDESVLC